MPRQILLADDSATIARMVQITFAHEDYQVHAVRSGDEAVARARVGRPDVVLIDAGLGGGQGRSGYDVCGDLRAAGLANVPILILTNNFVPYDEARGQRVGADGAVVKPFETQALIDRVGQVIAARASGGRPAAAAAPATGAPTAAATAATMMATMPPAVAQAVAAQQAAAQQAAAQQAAAQQAAAQQAAAQQAAAQQASAQQAAAQQAAAQQAAAQQAAAQQAAAQQAAAQQAAAQQAAAQQAAAQQAAAQQAAAQQVAAQQAAAQQAAAQQAAAQQAAAQQAANLTTPFGAAATQSPPARAVGAAQGTLTPTSVTAARPPAAAQPPPAARAPTGSRPAVTPSGAPVARNPESVANLKPPPRATLMGLPTVGPDGLPVTLAPPPAAAPPVVRAAPPASASSPPHVSEPAARRPESAPRVDRGGDFGQGATLPGPGPRVTADIAVQAIAAARRAPATIPPSAPRMPRPSLVPNAPSPEALRQLVTSVAAAATARIAPASALGAHPEYEAIARLSREVIEQIAWEVVPELAEVMIKGELDRLVRERARG